ncbi:metallophosphoesterase [Denitromonas sp.]|uniref:metallophosphoesterase n=1 Tax=Denitromonas sp. TaxID=2734609 RepID=UPI002AFEE328|nr:metallophosphoesterase [Denitromonas sp.]
MKIALQSDLHFEFSGNGWTIPDDISSQCEVLVLAGDIHSAPYGVDEIARSIAQQHGIEVVCVAGNHEYYGERLPSMLRKMRDASAHLPGVHFLENDAVILGGVRFLGCTLWTDFRLYGGGETKQRAMDAAGLYMNDFRLIRMSDKHPARPELLHPGDTAAWHKQSLKWLDARLSEPFDGQTVVVTHHLPSIQSVPERFRDNIISAAFASDLDAFIERHQPALWLHGHTHSHADYLIGKTRVVANPRGYPREQDTGFDPDLVLEV